MLNQSKGINYSLSEDSFPEQGKMNGNENSSVTRIPRNLSVDKPFSLQVETLSSTSEVTMTTFISYFGSGILGFILFTPFSHIKKN